MAYTIANEHIHCSLIFRFKWWSQFAFDEVVKHKSIFCYIDLFGQLTPLNVRFLWANQRQKSTDLRFRAGVFRINRKWGGQNTYHCWSSCISIGMKPIWMRLALLTHFMAQSLNSFLVTSDSSIELLMHLKIWRLLQIDALMLFLDWFLRQLSAIKDQP